MKFPTGIPKGAPGSFQHADSFQYSTVEDSTVQYLGGEPG